jgi:hypothetical protein
MVVCVSENVCGCVSVDVCVWIYILNSPHLIAKGELISVLGGKPPVRRVGANTKAQVL